MFIFGIGGLTGSKLASYAKKNFEIYGSYLLRNPEYNFVKSTKLDIKNFDAVKQILLKIKPNFVINACALNNVDYCEKHENEAKVINVDFVNELNKITYKIDAQLLQLSTDSVFDGTKKNSYEETDEPKPINVYGHTKLMGEKIVLENSNNLVIRASILYGWLPKNLAFQDSSSKKPTNFGQWLINKLKSKETVKIITDELSSPIIADDFAKSIIHLINKKKEGLFHSAPPLQISRYDFSKQLANGLNLDLNLIQPISNKELGRNVKTGFNKCLNPSKIIKETNFNFSSLENSFKLLNEQFNQN